MFELDLCHYTATLLHPRCKKLKEHANIEREEVYDYVIEGMKRII